MKYLSALLLAAALVVAPACGMVQKIQQLSSTIESVAPIVNDAVQNGKEVLEEATAAAKDLKEEHRKLKEKADLNNDGQISGVAEYATYGNGLIALLLLYMRRRDKTDADKALEIAHSRIDRRKRKDEV